MGQAEMREDQAILRVLGIKDDKGLKVAQHLSLLGGWLSVLNVVNN